MSTSRLSALWSWFDSRMPSVAEQWRIHASEYYAPKNFNFWYFFGALAGLVLVIQIVSGIFLTMNYKPDAALAFGSVEYIMRDVPGGWLLRYIHSTGASAFFVVVYLHMFRGMLYGSYKQPRELVWIFGVLIYLTLMGEAFFGYLLPWGQMSYWGAQVIVNLFGSVPFIGPDLALWIRGDYVVSDATLNRFFALHVIAFPLVLLGLVVAHILALHDVGSNNPDGVEIKKHKDANGHPLDGIPFHPYYTVKDMMGAVVFLVVFCSILFFVPEVGGYFLEYNNFIPADPLKTPPHIAPVWYFTPLAVPGRAGDGNRHLDPFLPAVARSQPGEVDPLPRRVLQERARDFRGGVPGAGLPRHRADHGVGAVPLRCLLPRHQGRRHLGGAGMHDPVLRFLHPDAVVHRAR